MHKEKPREGAFLMPCDPQHPQVLFPPQVHPQLQPPPFPFPHPPPQKSRIRIRSQQLSPPQPLPHRLFPFPPHRQERIRIQRIQLHPPPFAKPSPQLLLFSHPQLHPQFVAARSLIRTVKIRQVKVTVASVQPVCSRNPTEEIQRHRRHSKCRTPRIGLDR